MRRATSRRTAVCALAALTALSVSCGTDTTEDTADTTEAVETTTSDPSLIEIGEADWEGLEKRSLPVMGGLELGVPAGHVVHHDGDMALVRTPFVNDAGRSLPTMVIAHVAQLPTGDPVQNIETFTTTGLGGIGNAQPVGEQLELFGLTMERWSFEAAADQPVGPHYLFSAYPAGTGGASQWQPFPLGELFLAETPNGVLAVGWIGADETGLAEAKSIFDVVAPTLSLVGEAPIAPLAPVSPIAAGGPPVDPPPPVDLPAGWSPLESSSQPLDGGTYSTPNLSTPMQFTIDGDWWVQPNLPSWVVITGDDSFGPGDRGVSFRTGIGWLIPVGSDYQVAGDAVAIDTAADLVAAAPANLSIAESSAAIGSFDAVQLDIEWEADDCGIGAVCEYQLGSIHPFPGESLRVGYSTRIYYLDEGVNEPIWIIATAPDPSWFERVEEVVATIEFG